MDALTQAKEALCANILAYYCPQWVVGEHMAFCKWASLRGVDLRNTQYWYWCVWRAGVR